MGKLIILSPFIATLRTHGVATDYFTGKHDHFQSAVYTEYSNTKYS